MPTQSASFLHALSTLMRSASSSTFASSTSLSQSAAVIAAGAALAAGAADALAGGDALAPGVGRSLPIGGVTLTLGRSGFGTPPHANATKIPVEARAKRA